MTSLYRVPDIFLTNEKQQTYPDKSSWRHDSKVFQVVNGTRSFLSQNDVK